jgi:hypothetical protein
MESHVDCSASLLLVKLFECPVSFLHHPAANAFALRIRVQNPGASAGYQESGRERL